MIIPLNSGRGGNDRSAAAAGLPALGKRVAVTPEPVWFTQIKGKKEERKGFLGFCLLTRGDRVGGGAGSKSPKDQIQFW